MRLDGNRAEASANELGWRHRRSADDSGLWRFEATLGLRLARTPQGWRIAALNARAIWTDEDTGVLTPPRP